MLYEGRRSGARNQFSSVTCKMRARAPVNGPRRDVVGPQHRRTHGQLRRPVRTRRMCGARRSTYSPQLSTRPSATASAAATALACHVPFRRVPLMLVASPSSARPLSPSPLLLLLLLLFLLSASRQSSTSSPASSLLLLLLDRVVPLLAAYALMPPPATCAAAAGGGAAVAGSRVRETKKALLGRSSGNAGGRSRFATSRSPGVAGAGAVGGGPAVVAKGTVSKITEKFQSPPPPPPPRTATAACRPPLPPQPFVKSYEIKRRQEKLLGELHRHADDRKTNAAAASARVVRPLPVGGGGGGSDSAVTSDYCGSSSDSEKSVCCGGVGPTEQLNDKPGSPHSSGYESVEETTTTAVVAAAAASPVQDENAASSFVIAAVTADPTGRTPRGFGAYVATTDLKRVSVAAPAVPYSWVFGDDVAVESASRDGFADVLDALPPPPPPPPVSSSSSDEDDDGAAALPAAPEDRLERLVTFASAASCHALTRAKPDDQDADADDELQADDVVDAAISVRRHFGGNAAATPVATATLGLAPPPPPPVPSCLSPILECSSTEPNSVDTVEDCGRYDDDDGDNKVYAADPRCSQSP